MITFGGGASSTKKKSTIITTTNIKKTSKQVSTVGDIGLTGKAAVKLGQSIGQTGENLLKISGKTQTAVMLGAAQTLKDVGKYNTIQQKEASNYAQALVGAAAEQSQGLLSTAKQQSQSLLGTAQTALSSAADTKQSENKYLIPYILVGIVGVIFAMKGLK